MPLAEVKRSEESIIKNRLLLIIGGKEIAFKERTLERNGEWAEKVAKGAGLVLEEVQKLKDVNKLGKVISVRGYRQIAELISDYTDGSVSVDQIMKEGTRTELLEALKRVKEAAGFLDVMWGICPAVTALTA